MRIVLAVLVSACAATFAVERADAARGVEFGIQDDAWLEFGPGRLSDRVARLDALGLDVVRVTLNWYRAEPSSGSYDWSRSDRLLRALRARGLRPVVTLWGAPRWANGGKGPNVAPTQADDFERFVEAASRRYRFVDRWIMWNEPNKATWLNPASPRTYTTQILNPGYRAVKAVDRRDRVAGGVTGPRGGRGGMAPTQFIRGMRSARAQLDAYAHHPYPVFPGDTPFVGGCTCNVLTMAKLERLLSLVGDAFPRARVWLTEYAYQTNPPDLFGVSRDLQARYIGEAARRVYAAPKVDMLIHYLYRDEPELARWQSGLETVAGAPKPALDATKLPVAQVRRIGTRVTVWGQIRPGDGRQRYVLQKLTAGSWVAVGGSSRTDARGYFARSVVAAKGTQLRVWSPSRRLTSFVLVVR